jgi:hypothetical protein
LQHVRFRILIHRPVCSFLLHLHFIRPDGQPCVEAQEFGLVRNMLIAAVEERYKDAGNDPAF